MVKCFDLSSFKNRKSKAQSNTVLKKGLSLVRWCLKYSMSSMVVWEERWGGQMLKNRSTRLTVISDDSWAQCDNNITSEKSECHRLYDSWSHGRSLFLWYRAFLPVSSVIGSYGAEVLDFCKQYLPRDQHTFHIGDFVVRYRGVTSRRKMPKSNDCGNSQTKAWFRYIIVLSAFVFEHIKD